MWKNINLEKCLSHIHALAIPGDKNRPSAHPSITISRMCGAGGRTVASQLVEYLQPHTPYGYHWTIFDRNLIEKVLEDHHLSRRLAEFLPEKNQSLVAEIIEKMRGRHPPASAIVEQTVETIWKLAAGGHVILVGRAANLITEKLDNVFHVRLVGSLEKRIARVGEVFEMGPNDARAYVLAQDAAKQKYLKEYFGRDIDDPMIYHLIINTDLISYENAARMISDAVLGRFPPPAIPD
jgi:cytidylate kinase